MRKYLFFLLIFTSACSTSNKNITVRKNTGNSEIILAREKVPGITMEELRKGKKFYVMNCSACHKLKNTYDYTALQWQSILVRMFVKAKITDSTTRALITNYVIAKSK